jgi:hypothetical protein
MSGIHTLAVDRDQNLEPNPESFLAALGTLQSGRFAVRSLEEAQDLATLLAGLCPDPVLTAMGLTELLVNGIEHGNLGIACAEKTRLKEEGRWREEVERRLALPENLGKRVHLTLTRGSDHWEFLIEDQGPGFPWRDYLEMQPERASAPNGRGIALARQLAFRDLEYLGPGNRVRASAPRRPPTQ